jgi:hypothetical protein
LGKIAREDQWLANQGQSLQVLWEDSTEMKLLSFLNLFTQPLMLLSLTTRLKEIMPLFIKTAQSQSLKVDTQIKQKKKDLM